MPIIICAFIFAWFGTFAFGFFGHKLIAKKNWYIYAYYIVFLILSISLFFILPRI